MPHPACSVVWRYLETQRLCTLLLANLPARRARWWSLTCREGTMRSTRSFPSRVCTEIFDQRLLCQSLTCSPSPVLNTACTRAWLRCNRYGTTASSQPFTAPACKGKGDHTSLPKTHGAPPDPANPPGLDGLAGGSRQLNLTRRCRYGPSLLAKARWPRRVNKVVR